VSIAGLFTLTSGAAMSEVSDYWSSFVLTVRYLNDDFDYDYLSQYINEFLVFAFYLFFLFSVSFVLINMFIAVILDIYCEQQKSLQQNRYETASYLREMWYAFKHVNLHSVIERLSEDLSKQHDPITRHDLEKTYGIDPTIASLIIKEFGIAAKT